MFIDEAKINVKAGDGGNGCISLHREKYCPKGGPDGGNGGKGGDIIIEGTSAMNTLSPFKKRVHFAAQRGRHGKSNNKSGKKGKDTIIMVPRGTIVYDDSSGKIIGDITRDGQQLIVAAGGRGGRGNAAFATAFYRVPTFSEKGEKVEDRWIRFELRLIAHVGLVGLPNVGKSTFLAAISAAKPKIASYPFTTLSPNLGVVQAAEAVSYIFADIPGVIEGAHQGKGLGDRFLRHISRTKILLLIFDLTEVDPESPLKNYNLVMNEIDSYSSKLAHKPMVVAANKIDIVGTEEAFFALEEAFFKLDIKCHPISALTREGIDDLLTGILKLLATSKKEDFPTEETELVVIDMKSEGIEERQFTIEKVEDYFVVHGRNPERMVQMLDLDNDEAVRHLQMRLKRMGVEEKLKKMGVKDGDFVVLGEYEFNFIEEKELKETGLSS